MKNPIFSCLVALCCFGGMAPVSAQTDNLPMSPGPFVPTDQSLATYSYPEWFRDVKFGIWAHWGPQAVPRQGDWYARGMYEGGSVDANNNPNRPPNRQYSYHVANYGHPSEFGYKDIIPLWKAEKWNPDQLMKLYKRVGARYFVSMGTHHDNFFLWNSQLHKWNSVNMGPKKDVVGLWQKAAKREGLFFGVSEHLGASYTWFQGAHRSDASGPKKGVPYDGSNPQYFDLYHEPALPGDNGWYTNNPKFQRMWFERIRELIDNYHPDLLYSDGGLPFGNDVGRSLIAHFYNQDASRRNAQGVVYACKQASDGRWVQDYERGMAEGIREFPWQTDTSIGDWYYRTGQKYMSGKEVIQMLVDIVSKNGNLLLNVVQTPEGDLEPDVMAILEDIAAWIKVNGEAIYGTRPWKIFGEGPTLQKTNENSPFQHIAGAVKDVRAYQGGDVRFTTKNNRLYLFCMEMPEGDILVRALGLDAPTGQKIKSVKLLGSSAKIVWSQNSSEARLQKPASLGNLTTPVFEVQFE